MKVKDMRLRPVTYGQLNSVRIEDQNGGAVSRIVWGRHVNRTRIQTIAIAKRMCDRFNLGQEKP